MQFTRKQIFIALLLLVAFFAGIQLTRSFYNRSKAQSAVNATVLLEQIKAVAKVITAEGYFTEIFTFREFYGFDIGMFRKQALVRVKAKVSAGYDLDSLKIEMFPEKKQIVIRGLPEPGILSLEHDLDYYDIQQGIFNRFIAADYNKLNEEAKNLIRQKAYQSDLFEAASEQRDKLFDMMRFIAEGAGWTLEIDTEAKPEKPENLEN